MESPYERALRDIEEVFGDRLKRAGPALPGVPDVGDALASVSPMNAEEVKLLAEEAGRYSVPLVALGGGTASKADVEGGSILINFDLMRGLRLPEREEPWVEAEPGASWLQLDDLLRAGMGPRRLPYERPPSHRRRLAGHGWPRRGLLRVRLAERERPIGEGSPTGRRARRGIGGGGTILRRTWSGGDHRGLEAANPAGVCGRTLRRCLRIGG